MKAAIVLCATALLLAGALPLALAGLPNDVDRINDKIRTPIDTRTQGSAYASKKGNEPGGPGDAFTYRDTEASATSNYNGIYYNEGKVTVEAGDKAKGAWVGTYAKNNPDAGDSTTAVIATNFDPEFSFQKGVSSTAGTYEGARAVAGSSGQFGLMRAGSTPGAPLTSSTATIDAYAPSAEQSVSIGDRRRSVAFTDIAPTSAAQSGTGNGPAAFAQGYEVAAGSRASRDNRGIVAPVTVGSREAGDRNMGYQDNFRTFNPNPPSSSVKTEAGKKNRRMMMRLRLRA